MNRKTRGIIFDLDNTLLRSHIDFPGMKKSVAQWLIEHGALDPYIDLSRHTTSQFINRAKEQALLTSDQEAKVWKLIDQFEEEGMKGAKLEEGVGEALEILSSKYHLVILTNNARHAALRALEETKITAYFSLIVGRDQVPALKHSPAGVQFIMEKMPKIPADEWLMIGDSWIDGMAAQKSGIPFLSYCGKKDDLARHGIKPIARISHWKEVHHYV